MELPDNELANAIEKLWKEIGDRSWESATALGAGTSAIWFRGHDGKMVGGFDLTNTPNAAKRAELIAKTINTLPRIIEILRR